MRRCYCPRDGDLTERLSNRDDARFCPECGETLTCILSEDGGDQMGKARKLKVMHETKNDTPKLKEALEPKTEPVRESKNGELVEKAFEALKELGGSATSPKLAEKLGFEGETRRDKARALMDRLIKEKRVHKAKHHTTDATAKKGEYVYSVVESKAEAAVWSIVQTPAVLVVLSDGTKAWRCLNCCGIYLSYEQATRSSSQHDPRAQSHRCRSRPAMILDLPSFLFGLLFGAIAYCAFVLFVFRRFIRAVSE